MQKQHFDLDNSDANSQRLANVQPKYSQVVYYGAQIADQNVDPGNIENANGMANLESPNTLAYRNCYSRFAFFNAFYGVYSLILLLIKSIFIAIDEDGLTIVLLIFSYTLWAAAFYIALKAYKEQTPSKLIVYLGLIFFVGLIETFSQSEILQAVSVISILTYIFVIFWISTLILLVILFVYCKKLKALMIEIQFLKLQQLQQTQDNINIQQ